MNKQLELIKSTINEYVAVNGIKPDCLLLNTKSNTDIMSLYFKEIEVEGLKITQEVDGYGANVIGVNGITLIFHDDAEGVTTEFDDTSEGMRCISCSVEVK